MLAHVFRSQRIPVLLFLALAAAIALTLLGPGDLNSSPAAADTSPEGCSANNLELDVQRMLAPGEIGPVGGSVVSPGQKLLYVVRVENHNGTGCDLTHAQVRMRLPGLDGQLSDTFIDLSPLSACTTLFVGEIRGVFPANGSCNTIYPPVEYIVNVNPGVTSIVARARVISVEGLQDTPEGQPGDSVDVDKALSSSVEFPEVTLEKTPDGGEVEADDVAGFTMTVTNLGPGVAKTVELDDELPAGYTWTENPDNPDCTITGGTTLHCDIGDMPASDTFTVTVETPTSFPEDCDVLLENLAVVSGANFEALQDPGDIFVMCPQLRIEKTPDGGVVVAPGTASFTIIVTNNGPGVAIEVTIDDELPAGYTWVENPDTAECTITGGTTLHCDVGDMANGATFEVTVETSVSDPGNCDDLLLNVVTAAATNNGVVTDEGDITVLCDVPQLTIEKSPDGGAIEPGDTASFTIVVTNLGPGTAFDTVLDDELPAGYTWTENPDDPDCTITGGTTLHCDIGDMGPGDVFTLTGETETNPDQPDCLLENLAVASATNHTEVSDPGDIECTSLKVGSVTTFLGGDSASGGNAWGIMAAGLGLTGVLGAAALVLRRRGHFMVLPRG